MDFDSVHYQYASVNTIVYRACSLFECCNIDEKKNRDRMISITKFEILTVVETNYCTSFGWGKKSA